MKSILFAVCLFASVVLAANLWSFEDATLTVQGKGAGVGGGVKEKYIEHIILLDVPTDHALGSLQALLLYRKQ